MNRREVEKRNESRSCAEKEREQRAKISEGIDEQADSQTGIMRKEKTDLGK